MDSVFEIVPQEQLEQCCIKAGFSFSLEQISYLQYYLGMLLHWNQCMNLVGPKDWETIFNSLILDSFHLSLFLQTLNVSDDSVIWDIGSGAGLPGIPLRVVWNKGQYWLIEAKEKRALFLTTILARRPLSKTYVYHGRVESLVTNNIQYPNVIISRAFMPWETLLVFVEDMLSTQGFIILLLQGQTIERVSSNWCVQETYVYSVQGKKRSFVALVKKDSES